jgi:hypothetical protein
MVLAQVPLSRFRARADAPFLFRMAAARGLAQRRPAGVRHRFARAGGDRRARRGRARAAAAATSGWRGCCRPPACACMCGAKATCRRRPRCAPRWPTTCCAAPVRCNRWPPVSRPMPLIPVAETQELDAMLADGDRGRGRSAAGNRARAVGFYDELEEPTTRPRAEAAAWRQPAAPARTRARRRSAGPPALAHADEVDRQRAPALAHQRAMAASTPPLAVPSSLVTTRPVRPSAASKACTCARAFWPVLPSTTSSTSCGAPGWPCRSHAGSSSAPPSGAAGSAGGRRCRR